MTYGERFPDDWQSMTTGARLDWLRARGMHTQGMERDWNAERDDAPRRHAHTYAEAPPPVLDLADIAADVEGMAERLLSIAAKLRKAGGPHRHSISRAEPFSANWHLMSTDERVAWLQVRGMHTQGLERDWEAERIRHDCALREDESDKSERGRDIDE